MKVNISGYAIWASACMCVCLCACVCAYVVLMFWMSIGGKTCVENSAELRQGSHKSLSLSLALVFSFPSPLSRFALSTMRLLWWLAVVWDSLLTGVTSYLAGVCRSVECPSLFLCVCYQYISNDISVLVSTYKEIVYCITEGFSFFCSCNKEANASSNTGVWSLILNITLPHWKKPSCLLSEGIIGGCETQPFSSSLSILLHALKNSWQKHKRKEQG